MILKLTKAEFSEFNDLIGAVNDAEGQSTEVDRVREFDEWIMRKCPDSVQGVDIEIQVIDE